MFINGFIVISLLITLTFIYGFLTFISDYNDNKCEMTYMFQYPQYVKISQSADERYRKYGLYAYSEGHFTERARNKHFNGIPVLFIPGNAGSHKQVRSLASVALRKALDSRSGFHFDYFTLDLNAELSGFNGALLEEQMEYANHSIHHILDLYSKNYVSPKSIILIGHSMGGIIAESLLTMQPVNSTLIPLIITLAAPHKRLPIVFDIYSHIYYSNIKNAYEADRKTSLISLAGGYQDFLVPASLTKGGNINVVTTHIPRVWLTVDHLCILWCKQLVLTLNRALFESVDIKTKQISMEGDHRISVFHQHLVHNSGIKVFLAERYKGLTNIDNKGEWIEYLPRQYSIRLPQGTKQIQWYMIRLVNQTKHEALTLLAVNLEVTDWMFICSASAIRNYSKVCNEGYHLSHLSEIAPSIRHKRRLIELNMHELLKKFSTLTHVVAKVLPTSKPVTLHVDTHSIGERVVTVNLPNRFSLKRQVIIEETVEKAIRYDLELPHLSHITQSYLLYVEATKCETENHHATASLIVPWAHHNVYSYFTETEHEPLDIRLYSSKPANVTNSTAYVNLTLDSECRYRISIQASIPHTFSQVARFYSPLLVANIATVILITFRHQLINLGTKGTCPFFFTSLRTGAKPYYVLPFVKIISAILGFNVVFIKILPVPDWHVLQEEGMDFLLLPFILYFVSVGFVWILAVLLSLSVLFFESTVHKIVLKLLSMSVTGRVTCSDWLIKVMHKFPGFVACVLALLSISTCGGLALCLGTVFYFLKLTQMAQDVLEEIVTKCVTTFMKKFKKKAEVNSNNKSNELDGSASDSTEESSSTSNSTEKTEETIVSLLRDVLTNNQIFFHFTIFGLWFLVTCLNVPSVLTWAHNFRYSPKLEPDPSFLPGFVLSSCAIPLWQCNFPNVNKKWYKQLSYVVYFSAVASLIFAIVSLYRLNYILTAVITIVTLHQVFAPKLSDEIVGEDESSPGPKEYYDQAKAKWE